MQEMLRPAGREGRSGVSAHWSASLFDRRTAVLIYLAVALPVTLWFVFVIAPFQGPDEAEHFMRAVQLSQGRAAIKVFPATKEAGDMMDHQLTKLGGYYEKVGGSAKPWFTAGEEDWREAWAEPLTGRMQPTIFSNTVIYFPTAHFAPAAAIAVTKLFDKRPLAWLYAGRSACALLTLAMFSGTIWLAPEIGMFLVAFALMPRVLFQTSVISADAFIIPISALVTALLTRLACDRVIATRLLVSILVAVFLLSLGKIAYFPVCMLPFLVATSQRGLKDRAVIVLFIGGVATAGLWALWFSYIRDKTFPINLNPNILPAQQTAFALKAPFYFLWSVLRSFNSWTIPYYLKGAVAGDIAGPGDFKQPFAEFPSKPAYFLFGILVASALVGPRRMPAKRVALVASCVVAFVSLLMVMLGLYAQNTGFGLNFVDGFQGRYLLPLLVLPVPFLPKFSPSRYKRSTTIGLLLLISAADLWASTEMWVRYHEAAQSSTRHLRDSTLVNLRYPAVNQEKN